MKKMMTGNEAIAQGAWEAGCSVASAYPGTPSTEILEHLSTYPDIYTEWAVNEKVAFEVASGASIAGARSFSAMKHVGLNVAADPLFTMAYEGVNGGFVFVSADDPGMHSSQNEQDNRFFAMHAKIVCIEPSDSEECRLFTKAAYDLSEQFDTLVMIRTTTRISHSKSIVSCEQRSETPFKPYQKNIEKYIMIPAYARKKHYEVEERLKKLAEFGETSGFNKMEINDTSMGIITSGISYQYVKEVFGDKVSYLKLGFTYPLPEKLIRSFASKVKELYIVEENDPFLEMQIKAMGIHCKGKEIIPICEELNPDIVRNSFNNTQFSPNFTLPISIPNRPPVLCAGCPHRGIFHEISKHKNVIITGDIGCYTLGMMPPLNAIDVVICMGASISAGLGMQKVMELDKRQNKVFGFIGDSTFYHSGITGLINAVYNNIPLVTVILDNGITAMTGHQENPGTGKNLMGQAAPVIDIAKLVESVGIKPENIRITDPYNLGTTKKAVADALTSNEPFVIITKQPCVLIKDIIKRRAKRHYRVNPAKCKRCKSCIRTGCPAISYKNDQVIIDPTMCIGCSICTQACKFEGMELVEQNS